MREFVTRIGWVMPKHDWVLAANKDREPELYKRGIRGGTIYYRAGVWYPPWKLNEGKVRRMHEERDLF